ncbi:MAG: transcriptional repressor [Thermodesulfobacteriota bacterium]
MTKLHDREKIQFKKLFSNEGVENFDDTMAVLEVFLGTEGHLTASELIDRLKAEGYDLDPSFVRESLRLLSHFGFARQLRLDDGKIRYEHCHLGDHHDHMICRKCGRIIEFVDDQIEAIQAEVAAAHGFHMLGHRMDIYGICSACLKNRARLIPLSRAKQGEHLVIESFTGGTNSRMRLLSMGLKTGDPVEVITCDPRGQVVIASGNKRYAIGRGLAGKVLARSADEQTSP